jgi:predicted nucleic acid-binding Zn ribbon protein
MPGEEKMIYQFQCPCCFEHYEDIQGANDTHAYICPVCDVNCRRVYSMPQVKKNSGFYSVTLGKEVTSHSDFENQLQKTRIESWGPERLHKLGYTHKLHSDSVEKYTKSVADEKKRVAREMEMAYEPPRR